MLDDAVAYLARESHPAAESLLIDALNTASSLDTFSERGRVVPLERIGIEAGGAVEGEDVVRHGVDDDDGARARSEPLVCGPESIGVERGIDVAAGRVFARDEGLHDSPVWREEV